jgi:hypothetical protein
MVISPCPVRFRPGWASAVVAAVVSARPASATRSFSAFPSGDSCFFAGEFVRRSFLVRRAATFRRDRALGLRIHCCESTRRLSYRSAAIIPFTSYAVGISDSLTGIASFADPAATTAASSASLVHEISSRVGLVCHFAISRRDNYQIE